MIIRAIMLGAIRGAGDSPARFRAITSAAKAREADQAFRILIYLSARSLYPIFQGGLRLRAAARAAGAAAARLRDFISISRQIIAGVKCSTTCSIYHARAEYRRWQYVGMTALVSSCSLYHFSARALGLASYPHITLS